MPRAVAQSSSREQELRNKSTIDKYERLILLKRQQYDAQEVEYNLRSAQLAKLRQEQEDESKARLSAFDEEMEERGEDMAARQIAYMALRSSQEEREMQLGALTHELSVKTVRLDSWEKNLKATARIVREEEARIAGMRDEAQSFYDDAKEAWGENKYILAKTRGDYEFKTAELAALKNKATDTLVLTEMERNGFLTWKKETEQRLEAKEQELDIKIKTATQLYGKNG